MAVFFHNNRTIPYDMALAPFAADLFLLQGSRFTADYWKPVLEDLASDGAAGGGRILTLEWPSEGFQAEDVVRLLQTLGMHNIHLVACDDAVQLIAEVQRLQPALFVKTLFYPTAAPKGDELVQAVRTICPV